MNDSHAEEGRVARDRRVGWVDGFAEWTEGDTAFLSVAFTWRLNALEKKPWVRADLGWTEQGLRDMARWANRRIWRYAPFSEYDANAKTSRKRKDQLELVA